LDCEKEYTEMLMPLCTALLPLVCTVRWWTVFNIRWITKSTTTALFHPPSKSLQYNQFTCSITSYL